MRKLACFLIALAFLPTAVLAQRNIDWDKVQIKTQKLDENVYLLQFMGPDGPAGNVGGNVGALISDDISMAALKGPLSVRTKAALFAGCDIVLHCNGRMEEMAAVASEAMPLQDAWLKRCDTALSHLSAPEPLDADAGEARLAQLLEGAS